MDSLNPSPPPPTTLESKVEALENRETYPGRVSAVEARETHMSWVFLTDRLVYKMKKPVQYERLDFSSDEKRYFYVREEVRLNRRLARGVYLGVVPVTLEEDGTLRVDGTGTPVEWLIKMRRLPADRMLDYAIQHHTVDYRSLRKAARLLAEFYRDAPSVDLSPGEYRSRFADLLAHAHTQLERHKERIPIRTDRKIRRRQDRFLDRHADLLNQRVRDRRIVEGHGDLRPQHICLIDPPVIYDCMEFSHRLRELDAADELSYLSLECRRMSNTRVSTIFWTAYTEATGDHPPRRLIDFYTSVHGCQRAQLVLRHLDDRDVENPGHWIDRATVYLRLAEAAAEALET